MEKKGSGKGRIKYKNMTQQVANYIGWEKKNSSLPIFLIFGSDVHQQHDLDQLIWEEVLYTRILISLSTAK